MTDKTTPIGKKAASKTVARKAIEPTRIWTADEIQIVSYSELDTFRQCPLKHYLTYVRRWTKPVKAGSALDKGSLWHLVMEDHYGLIKAIQTQHKGRVPKTQVKRVLAAAMELVKQRLIDDTTGEFFTEVHELVMWMYEGYVENYGVDDDWIIVAIEHQIVVPLQDKDGNDSRYHLKMKLDLIVRERSSGHLWIVDHKSGSNLPNKMDLEIDDQFGLYTWGMRRVGRKVLGTIHSAARTTQNAGDKKENQDENGNPLKASNKKQTLDQRMLRTYMNRGEVELTNLALDAFYAARAAYPDDPAYAARYSSPDPRSCGWKCDVKEPHLLMRTGRNPDEVMIEYGFTVNRTRH